MRAPSAAEVEECWKTFWEGIVAPDGEVNMEQLKLELFDFKQVMDGASELVSTLTFGNLSKCDYDARVVIDEHERVFDCRGIRLAEKKVTGKKRR